ncbi:MAG: ATP-grasp fold amidoligase family protein [Spirochaetales bacterium]|nr:ATP-grasp fold amidoligase family protein [Spirochaetales bacterium]
MYKLIVVILTYNLEKYIREAINSVLNQKTSYQYKILIGDDCSSDGTQEILKEYAEKYPGKIEIRISDKNLGCLGNSNRLFDGLQCEYFSLLDGDDVWLDENHLQKQIDFLESHKEYSMCAANTQYLKDNKPAEFLIDKELLDKTYTFDDLIKNQIPYFHPSTTMFRNTIFINGLPECYKNAVDTFENCALRGDDFRRIQHLETGPVYIMSDLLSYYRIHENGIWQGTSDLKRNLEGTIEYNFLRKYYKNTQYFDFFNGYFSYMYKQLMKYLVLDQDIVNKYELNTKNNYLLTSLLTDIVEQNIPLNTTYYVNLTDRDNEVPLELKQILRNKLKRISILRKIYRKIITIKENTKQRKQDKLNNTVIDWSNLKNYKRNLKIQYKKSFNKKLNLRNPKTFSEKMFWLRLYDNTEEKTILSDKILVRDWIKNKIGDDFLIPLYGTYEKFDDIDFSILPNSFVIKTNHGSGTNILVKDKSKLDIDIARKTVNEWLNTDYSLFAGELQYKKIKPKILIEKYLDTIDDDIPDYKYFCFNGKPVYILYCCNRYKKEELDNSFFDLNWNNMKFNYSGNVYDKDDVPVPENFDKMNEIAELLCKNFKHVRVDLYNIKGKIYFGEMTFTSYAGLFHFTPAEWDDKLGNMLKL